MSNDNNAGPSTSTPNMVETADSVLNTVGEQVANATGQDEAVQKATTFVEQKVLNVQAEPTDLKVPEGESATEEVGGFGAAKEHVDAVEDEKIEEFMRHQTRSYQG